MHDGWILFDLDGTLIDGSDGIVASCQFALKAAGLTADPEELRAHIGRSLRQVFSDFGVSFSALDDAIEAYRSQFIGRELMLQGRMYDGVPEMLQACVDDGWCLGLATAKPYPVAQRIVDHLGIGRYFSYVAGSTMSGSRSTKVDIIHHALTMLEAESARTWMVGDRGEDLLGAAVHGLRSVAVSWGFGHPDEFTAVGLTGVATVPSDVLRLVGRRGQSVRSVVC